MLKSMEMVAMDSRGMLQYVLNTNKVASAVELTACFVGIGGMPGTLQGQARQCHGQDETTI